MLWTRVRLPPPPPTFLFLKLINIMKLIMENWRVWKESVENPPADGLNPVKQNVYDTHQGGAKSKLNLTKYNLDPRIEKKVKLLLTDKFYEDIGVKIYKPDYFKRDGVFYTIQYCNMSTRQGRSSKDPGGPGGSVGISLPHKVQSFKDGPCLQGAVITSTRATRGWGPLLYEVALEVASYLSFGLAADRGSPKTGVSPFAREVWAKYAMRSDIQSYQLDVDSDTTLDSKSVGLQNITPDRSDDCNQTAAYRSPGGPMSDLVDHPLTLMYKKDNHNLYDALVDNNRMIDISG